MRMDIYAREVGTTGQNDAPQIQEGKEPRVPKVPSIASAH